MIFQDLSESCYVLHSLYSKQEASDDKNCYLTLSVI